MRLDAKILGAFVAQLVLPPALCLLGCGFFTAVFAVGALVLIQWAVMVRTFMKSSAKKPMVLETITASHYGEKVRWCLDLIGEVYVEDQDIGIFGMLVQGRQVPVLHVPTAGGTSVRNSSDIVRYLDGRYGHTKAGAFLRATPEKLELEERFDKKFGRAIQRWVYFHILECPEVAKRLWGLEQPRVPRWQRVLLGFPGVFQFLRFSLKSILGVNKKSCQRSEAVIHETLSLVEKTLSDGRNYLSGGDKIDFVDITIASLAAPLWMPSNYGGGAIEHSRFITSESFPRSMSSKLVPMFAKYGRTFAYFRRIYHKDRSRTTGVTLPHI